MYVTDHHEVSKEKSRQCLRKIPLKNGLYADLVKRKDYTRCGLQRGKVNLIKGKVKVPKNRCNICEKRRTVYCKISSFLLCILSEKENWRVTIT